MIKEIVRYTDWNGNQVEDELYFNLNTIEISKFTTKYDIKGDFENYISYITKQENLRGMVDVITDLIETSYGEKSLDGKTFIKNDEIKEKFKQSIAYAELFEKYIENTELFKKFIEGVMDKQKNNLQNVTN